VEVKGDGDEKKHGPGRCFPSDPNGFTYYVYGPPGVLFKAEIHNGTAQAIDVQIETVTGDTTAEWPPVPRKITVAANSKVLVPTGILGPPSDFSGRYWRFEMEGRDPVTVEIVKHETEPDDSGMEEDDSGTRDNGSPIVWHPTLGDISVEVKLRDKAMPFFEHAEVGQNGMRWRFGIPSGEEFALYARLHGNNHNVDVTCRYLIDVDTNPTSPDSNDVRELTFALIAEGPRVYVTGGMPFESRTASPGELPRSATLEWSTTSREGENSPQTYKMIFEFHRGEDPMDEDDDDDDDEEEEDDDDDDDEEEDDDDDYDYRDDYDDDDVDDDDVPQWVLYIRPYIQSLVGSYNPPTVAKPA
jgi:hypothetical protein